MKARSTLSIAPYYGGKARMAHFITDRLDYANSDVFVTPFGGMCRVLLNKPRHRVECYNDFDDGLNALMRVLSTPSKASELIHQLYYNTEYSQAEFNRQKAIYDNAKFDLEEQEREKLRKLLIETELVSANQSNKLIDEIVSEELEGQCRFDKTIITRLRSIPKKENETVKAKEDRDKENECRIKSQFRVWRKLYKFKAEQGFIERTSDIGEFVSEMDLAIATYVVYQQSMDGRGQAFSKSKFKSTEQYQQRILNLYECAERLKGVHIYQIDAVEYFREFKFVNADLLDEEIDPEFLMMNEWVNNSRVMMYCDPSYISPDDERDLLEGINVNEVSSLSDAIKARYEGQKEPENLGKIYARSFSYDEQEKFLRCIQHARCKILVSNYDLQLYNKYLNEETGWRREEFHTTTGVGSKKDNKRVEVIWYNY